MRCYEHREQEALGTCNHCSRGLCAECLTEVGVKIACRTRCAESVRQLEEFLAVARSNAAFVRTAHLINFLTYGFLGLALFLLGVVGFAGQPLLFMIGLGAIMGAFAFSSFFQYARLRIGK